MALASFLLQRELSHLDVVVEGEVCGSQGRLVYFVDNSSSVVPGLPKCLGVLPLPLWKHLWETPWHSHLAVECASLNSLLFDCGFGNGTVKVLGERVRGSVFGDLLLFLVPPPFTDPS